LRGLKAAGPDERETAVLPFDVLEPRARVPEAAAGSVFRTALVNRLRAAGTYPLVLVVAPAGYGKTTLLAQWAERDARPFAWVSVDEHSNEPIPFLRHVAAALDGLEPVAAATLNPLQADDGSVWTRAVPRLAATLAGRDSPLVLVVDGADLLSRESISALTAVTERLPAGSLVALSGRVAPKLPLAVLRSREPLLEIGAYELALSRREAEMLLRAMRIELDDVELTKLVERTEGWATGVRLTALAACDPNAGEGAARPRPTAVTGDDRFVADYLRSEYLARLSPERLAFLRRTSVLETMSGPLCDAVLERPGSALELAALEEENLFVVHLDRNRGRYRYHRLFRELLRRELEDREPKLVPVLNQRAADWFEAQGDAEATLGYSYAAGNEASAARILSTIAMPVSASGRVAAVESWLGRFDDQERLRRYPGLAVEGSRIHAFAGRSALAESWLAAAEHGSRKRNGAGATIRACIEVLRAAMCTDGPQRMLASTKSALTTLPREHPWHPWALVVNGTAHLLLGDDEQADDVLASAAEASGGGLRTESHALALSERAVLAAGRDDDAAEALALEARHLIADGELDAYPASALDLAATARAFLRHGRWDEARRQLTIAERLAPSLTHAVPWLSVQVRLELGHAYVTLRDRNAARRRLAEARELLSVRPALGVLGDRVSGLEAAIDAMPQAAPGGSGLTPAELRLLPLLATHLSFREIGERLFVSRNTIKTQAISVYRKLGVSSRSTAIMRARELGLVDDGTAALDARAGLPTAS
jgi:LuxR family maltose regulon positive regulatory protein